MLDNVELELLDDDSQEEILYKIGTLKENGKLDWTWEDIRTYMNDACSVDRCESFWRKKYRQLVASTEHQVPLIYDTELDAKMKSNIRTIAKEKLKLQAENKTMRKMLKNQATFESLISELTTKIETIEPLKHTLINVQSDNGKHVVYALLSDIHYGLSFTSFYGDYNPKIACERVLKYADEIIRIGKLNKASVCYVSIMGDMVSGIAHQTIRLENCENVIDQVLHVSELTAAFLAKLGNYFTNVYVNSVSGNHSRIDVSADNSLRAERLDNLVPWYSKARLSKYKNIEFEDNDIDPSMARFNILGHNYVSVHGDFDNTKDNISKIKEALGFKVDYFLAAHMHVAEMRMDHTGFIRNGAVVSGGDDYTSKKRLFAPAFQVCMICNESGVEAIYPVSL